MGTRCIVINIAMTGNEVRYIAVDGYLLQTVQGKSDYKIVSYKNVRRRMTSRDRKLFDNEDLIDLDYFLSNENELFNSTSQRLFEMIPSKLVSFWKQKKPRATKAVTKSNSAEVELSSKKERVIPIVYETNHRKYLRYTHEAIEYELEKYRLVNWNRKYSTDFHLHHKLRKSINDLCCDLFDFRNILFTNSDCSILEKYSHVKKFYEELSVKLVEGCYRTASLRGDHSVISFGRSPGEETFVLQGHEPETIEEYGVNFAPFLFILLHADSLSIFTDYKEVGSPRIDSDKLCAAIKEGSETDLTCWSSLCINILAGNDSQGSMFRVLIRCCAIKLDNLNPREKREAESARKIRKNMEAIIKFFLFAILGTESTRAYRLFDSDKGCSNWKWFKSVYDEIVSEEEDVLENGISLSPATHGVYIAEELFDRQYIKDFHNDCASRIADLLTELDKDFKILSVEEVACRFLNNQDLSFEAFGAGCGGTFIDSLPDDEYRAEVILPFIPKKINVFTMNRLNLIVDEIGQLLMWMIFLGVGHAYQYSDLQRITYRGPRNNIYIDDKTRRLQICIYDETRSSEPILKTMDGVTSKHLFHFISILRRLQLGVLRNYIDYVQVDGPSHEYTILKALTTYVFYDIDRESLVSFSKFNVHSTKFPIGRREKLKFEEISIGMTTLIENYITPLPGEFWDKKISMIHETMMDYHSFDRPLVTHVPDNFSLIGITGKTALQFQELASRTWISWLGLEDDKQGINR